MEMIFAIVVVVMSVLAFVIGKRYANKGDNAEKVLLLESRINELTSKISTQEFTISEQIAKITLLTSERDVQRTNAENATKQLEHQNNQSEILRKQEAERYEKVLSDNINSFNTQLNEQKIAYEKQITTLRDDFDTERKSIQEHSNKSMSDMKESYEAQIKAINDSYEKHLKQVKENSDKQAESYKLQISELKKTSEVQISELKDSFDKQLIQVKENAEKQLKALREMNEKQVKGQLDLIKDQMRATSEEVLKARQEELGIQNKEQVSKIIDPLQQSLKDMKEALDKSKDQHNDALLRLDQTIKLNMEKSSSLGETADRLARALTGKVKVQGNFGELKLKQLLEDLALKEGEQFSTQHTLRDKYGNKAKGDDEKGLIPDFILHFPDNRHVVVDSKMSLTDYERYMNAEDGSEEKNAFLNAHISSVKSQVSLLAKKGYTKYLPDGYNKLNFAIMYIPIEGALNLALLNDTTLWREAYDQGVMILGPQTMYMNLRVLEMMWTQVKQLKNQQTMMDAANTIIDRVQDFGIRFMDVESSMNDTIKKMSKLKITTADSGVSIITAAKNLLKAGAQENKKKKSIAELDDSIFIESDSTAIIPSDASIGRNGTAID